MKRTLMLGGLAVAALTASLLTSSANAAPVGIAPLAAASDTAANTVTPVTYRHRGYGYSYGYRPGFALYLGAPSYGPRCWWSHRHHRRVCSYY
jgi:hypothetical protein